MNVASKCGFTPQYAGLEKLYREYEKQGLVVLGFPANDFRQQEPGTEAEIKTFCSTNYDVTFPMFSKIAVTGEKIHPLYRWLTGGEVRLGVGRTDRVELHEVRGSTGAARSSRASLRASRRRAWSSARRWRSALAP